VYATNVSTDMLTVTEALALGRCRWQIELLWKLWKSEGRVDDSRSAKPWRILTEVYAKLLGMVVQHWMLLTSCWSFANRSLRKASSTIRAHALNIAIVLPHRHLVRQTMQTLQRVLQRGSRVGKRKARPPNHEILRSLDEAA
jgi:Transposase DDE domain